MGKLADHIVSRIPGGAGGGGAVNINIAKGAVVTDVSGFAKQISRKVGRGQATLRASDSIKVTKR